jgi:hypothetical protein
MMTTLNNFISSNNILVLVFLMISLSSFAQWQMKSGNNDIDGNFKTSSVIGTGVFPYTKPLFVVNSYGMTDLNIYLSSVGFAGCDNLHAIVKFDTEKSTNVYEISTDLNKDTWFIGKRYGSANSHISNIELLQKLKTNNFVTIRLLSDCSEKEYKFALSGSSKAINFAAGTYIQAVSGRLNQIENEQKAKIEQEKKEEIAYLTKKDSVVSRIATQRILIYDKPSPYDLRVDIFIEKGDNYKISLISKNSEYYFLNFIDRIDISKFQSLYIKKSETEEIKL